MKVAVICPAYPDAADITKQNHIHHQLLAFRELGMDVLAVDLWPEHPQREMEVFESLPVLRFGPRPRGLLRGPIFRTWQASCLYRLLRSRLREYHVIHLQNALFPFCDLGKHLDGRPLVITCHGDDIVPTTAWGVEKRRRTLMKSASAIVSVSHFSLEQAQIYSDFKGRYEMIPNGITLKPILRANEVPIGEAREKLGLPGDARILLTACSLMARKGVMEIAEAFRKLSEELPSAFWVVIGRGPLHAQLQTELARHGLLPKVRLIEYVATDAEMALYYRACDVYCMLSRSVRYPDGSCGIEGFGISYIDASAAAKPVVGGRSGGVPTAVQDGITGFLVDPYHPRVVEHLLEKLKLLMTDQHLALRMGTAGQKNVLEQFTWKRNAERHAALYAELLDGANRRVGASPSP